MSETVDINLMSSLHGTPLHLACKIGNLKIIQQLLINGADLQMRCTKNGKLAKDYSANQRVVYLIEKYEKLRALETQSQTDNEESSSEEEQEEEPLPTSATPTKLLNKLNSLRSQFSFKATDKKPPLENLNLSSSLQQITEEEDHDYYDEEMLDDIEKHAGTALDQAQIYIDDFQKSRIELLASVHGYLFAQGSLSKTQYKRYFKLRADCGVLIKFESQKSFESL